MCFSDSTIKLAIELATQGSQPTSSDLQPQFFEFDFHEQSMVSSLTASAKRSKT